MSVHCICNLTSDTPMSLATAAEMELKQYCASLFTLCDPGSSDNLGCPASSSASMVEREMQSVSVGRADPSGQELCMLHPAYEAGQPCVGDTALPRPTC